MRKIYVLFLLIFCTAFQLNAQWTKTNGPYGSIVHTMITKGNCIYFGSEGGSIFKSDNGGVSWSEIEIGKNITRVVSLIQLDSSIYAGTLKGVFKSDDNGVSWTHSNLVYYSSITCLATNGKTIYAGTDEGVIYKSNDYGQRWKAESIPYNKSIVSLAAIGEILFAGTEIGVFVSKNEGSTWMQSNVGMSKTSLYISNFAIRGKTVYACTSDGLYRREFESSDWINLNVGGTPQGIINADIVDSTIFVGTYDNGVYKSNDGGNNWIQLNNGLRENSIVNNIIIKGDTVYAGAEFEGVYKSEDAGQNWKEINHGLYFPFVNSLIVKDSCIIAGLVGGVFIRDKNDTNWSYSGLTSQVVTCLAYNENTVYAGSGNGVFKSIDGCKTWTHSDLTTGFTGAIRSIVCDGNTVFACSGSELYKSEDGGNSWKNIKVDIMNPDINSILVNNSIVYVATSIGLFLSVDGGSSWERSPLITNKTYDLTSIGSVVYVRTDKGIFKTTNSGSSWLQVNSLVPKCFAVKDSILYLLTSDGYFFKSDDGGTVWKRINSGITDISLSCFVVSDKAIYVGADYMGVIKIPLNDITSVEETPHHSAFISPQPVRDEAEVTYSVIPANAGIESGITIELYDLRGTLVATYNFTSLSEGSNKLRFDVSNLVSGMYNVIIKSGTEVHQAKMIKVD